MNTVVPAAERTAGLSDASSIAPHPHEASAGRLPTGHVVLDLPVPPSVNKTRRINWAAPYSRWVTAADNMLLAVKYHPAIALRRFELHITFSESHTRMDLDNGLKALIDYLKRIEAIADDAPANLRRLVVEWGDAPAGVRVVIKGAV